MSMSVADLEGLLEKLNRLAHALKTDPRPAERSLGQNDRLVSMAEECEFPLPTPLTVNTLIETVDRKINNVQVLLERARMHEQLPPDAQEAAEQEYDLPEEKLHTHESVYGLRRE